MLYLAIHDGPGQFSPRSPRKDAGVGVLTTAVRAMPAPESEWHCEAHLQVNSNGAFTGCSCRATSCTSMETCRGELAEPAGTMSAASLGVHSGWDGTPENGWTLLR